MRNAVSCIIRVCEQIGRNNNNVLPKCFLTWQYTIKTLTCPVSVTISTHAATAVRILFNELSLYNIINNVTTSKFCLNYAICVPVLPRTAPILNWPLRAYRRRRDGQHLPCATPSPKCHYWKSPQLVNATNPHGRNLCAHLLQMPRTPVCVCVWPP